MYVLVSFYHLIYYTPPYNAVSISKQLVKEHK